MKKSNFLFVGLLSAVLVLFASCTAYPAGEWEDYSEATSGYDEPNELTVGSGFWDDSETSYSFSYSFFFNVEEDGYFKIKYYTAKDSHISVSINNSTIKDLKSGYTQKVSAGDKIYVNPNSSKQILGGTEQRYVFYVYLDSKE